MIKYQLVHFYHDILDYIIGVTELTKQGRIIISHTYDAITIFFAIALLYLILTSIVSLLITKLEQKMGQHVKN